MAFSIRPAGVLRFGLLMVAPLALAQRGAGSSHPTTPVLLPPSFAGWSAATPPQTSPDPSVADPPNASVLKEYGLKQFAAGEYRRGSSKINVKAMQFVDATGAYGAFTFYRKPAMRTDAVGGDSAADSYEVVFWTGTTFLDATSDQVGPEVRAALRALASQMPQNAGPEAVPPSLPRYLPGAGLQQSTIHYAIGPEGYLKTGGVLPTEIVDFSRDAEAITAEYHSRDGNGTVTILEYPTPQMADDRAKAIQAVLKGTLPSSLQSSDASALGVKHTGPLVAVTSGNFSGREAQELLGDVKFGATVSWNHTEAYVGEVRKTARLLLGILYLTGVLGGAAVLLGLFLGGGRALVRVLRGKPPSTLNDDDFISLKLGG
jgi:hypothetical protein